MIQAPARSAACSSAKRRSRLITTPSGCWCEGVTKARRKRGARRSPSSTRRPCVVDRHRHQLGAGGDQAVARADRPRVLEPHAVAGIEQHRADQRERLLRAADDEDLLGVAADAAIGAQVRGDRLAQRRVAERFAVAHARRCGCARQCLADSRAHCAIGKASKAGSAVVKARATEGRRAALAEALDRAGHRARQPRGCASGLAAAPAGRPRPRWRSSARDDVGAGADARIDQALRRSAGRRPRSRWCATRRARAPACGSPAGVRRRRNRRPGSGRAG